MSRKSKPGKPYDGFPLYPHARGQWAKKIRGKTYYFGRVADGWQAALELYQLHRDDLQAGLGLRPAQTRLSVGDLVNEYLAATERRVDVGEMARASWADSLSTLKMLSAHLGRDRPVDSLRVIDFESFRATLCEKYGSPATIAGHIARTKAALKWAYDVELVPNPIRIGPNFRRPTASQFRRARAAKPAQLFAASELRPVIATASRPLRAMILLGLNAALGNRDCGELEHRHLELDRGWLTYARNKTGIARRAALWPETVDAIRLAIAHRPDPAERRHSGRVFLTIRGAPFAKETTRTSPVSAEFAKALGRHAVAPGRGFYALRHTFRTVADGCGDTTAVRHIMGHVDHSIDGQYRETIADARLRDVSEYVREWFLADGPAAG